jgi:hypothetical protein
MSEKMDIELKKCITPEFRVSFPQVIEPKAFGKQAAKYSIVMLFTKKTDLNALKKAAHNAAVEKWGKDKTSWPKNLKMPFRDGNEKSDLMGYEDTIFVSASSKDQPGLVDQKKQEILSDRDFYAGCYARAQLLAFAYDKPEFGTKGVSFGLQHVQKVRDGEKFSGRKNASDVFDEVEDGSGDASSYDNEVDGDDAMGF